MPDATIGTIAPEFTIECAFAVTTLNTSMVLAGKQTDTVEWSIETDAADSNQLNLVINDLTQGALTFTICPSLSAAGVLADNAWHYLSLSFTASANAFTTKIDNILTATNTMGGSVTWTEVPTSVIVIGARDKAGTDNWQGYVDEFAIYHRPLGSDEQTENYRLWRNGTLIDVQPLSFIIKRTTVLGTQADGAFTSPLLETYVQGGIGPFTYNWTTTGSLTPDNQGDPDTTWSGTLSGSINETVTCTVTDTGLLNNTAAVECAIIITGYSTLALTLNSNSETASVTQDYTSPFIAGTPTGGVEPYSFRWTRSGPQNSTVIIADSSFVASTQFVGNASNQLANEQYTLTVTDALGATATDTVDFSITFGSLNPLSLSVNQSAFTGEGDGTITTALAIVSAVGATVYPWTVSWARVSGSTIFAADNADERYTTFTGTAASGTIANEVWRCSVTDSSPSPQAATIDITLNQTFLDLGRNTLSVNLTPDVLNTTADSRTTVDTELVATATGGYIAEGENNPYKYTWSIRESTNSNMQLAILGLPTNYLYSRNLYNEVVTGVVRVVVEDYADPPNVAADESPFRVTVGNPDAAPLSVIVAKSLFESTEAAGPWTSGDIGISISGGNTPYTCNVRRVSGTDYIVGSRTTPFGSNTGTPTFFFSADVPYKFADEVWELVVQDFDGFIATTQIGFRIGFGSVEPLSLTLDPQFITEIIEAAAPQTSTATARAIISGGIPPYSVEWVYRQGTSIISPVSPNSESTQFSISVNSPSPRDVQYRCTVTDSQTPPAIRTEDIWVRMQAWTDLYVELVPASGVFNVPNGYQSINNVAELKFGGGSGFYQAGLQYQRNGDTLRTPLRMSGDGIMGTDWVKLVGDGTDQTADDLITYTLIDEKSNEEVSTTFAAQVIFGAGQVFPFEASVSPTLIDVVVPAGQPLVEYAVLTLTGGVLPYRRAGVVESERNGLSVTPIFSYDDPETLEANQFGVRIACNYNEGTVDSVVRVCGFDTTRVACADIRVRATFLPAVEPFVVELIIPDTGVIITQSPNGSAASELPAVVTAVGGVEPYTVLWTEESNPTNNPIVAIDDDQLTTFFASSGENDNASATMRCTVTDSDSPPSVASVTVGVGFSFTNQRVEDDQQQPEIPAFWEGL